MEDKCEADSEQAELRSVGEYVSELRLWFLYGRSCKLVGLLERGR